MKKIWLIFLVILCFTMPINAEESIEDEIISSIDGELSDFQSSLPDYVGDFLPNEIFEGDFSNLTNGEINQISFIDYIIDYLLATLPSVLKSFSTLLALVLIISIFNIIKKSFASEGLKNAFSLVSVLCVSITVFSTVSSLTEACIEYVNSICGAMNCFTPIMSAMYIMTGSISSAAVSNASMMLFLSIVENFIVVALVPIIKTSLSFSVVTSLSEGVNLSGISKTIKNLFTSICALLMSIFSFVMSYQSVLTQDADSLYMRTARFAIGNFIPIVGGFVGDSLKTVSSSLSLIKNSCGVIAIIVIVLIAIPIIVSLSLYKICFSAISGIARMLGIEKECCACDEASSICGFVLAILSLTCIVFVFALTIFIKSSTGVYS